MAPTNAVQGLPLGTINESAHRQSEPFPQMVGPFRDAWKPLAVGAGLFRRGSYSGLPADGSQRSACELTGDFAKTYGTNSYRTLRGGDWGLPKKHDSVCVPRFCSASGVDTWKNTGVRASAFAVARSLQ